jgi:hypothetical protein
MECELVAQREQMAAKQREHMEEKEKLKRLKVLSGTLFAAVLRIHNILEWIRIRILLFSSLTFKMSTKNNFF